MSRKRRLHKTRGVHRRRRPLVVQHLENISRAALEEYQTILRDYVKGRHGIYALYGKNKLYYVGLASDLRNRLKSHLKNRHARGWDRFSLYLTKGGEHLRELEAFFLRIAKPKGNLSKTRLSQAKDLRRVLRQRIKEQQRTELASLFQNPPKKLRRGQPRRRAVRAARIRLSDVIEGRLPIRMTYKGRTHSASIRKSGSIGFRGKTYDSPSGAARAITGRPTNGWFWWKYEAAPGKWVRLEKLRG